ncbi:MAG: 16S rRNA (uracil(1498)-N(3))-methyltransferase [Pigmentiphaga sp.]|uniref:16S rRNA (uracil(1498)-N(3))-methyltransferase n=1 Tax=Pigmentiphaga sp. TaxID=1977564 RepID=UPI0029B0CDD1|nr:16S rRNA (uracil(1498)-N(3))-methyltransferase [Pigmentiphaga sp.]MDX3904743.1 16S rRNA (uracil(1498)-N(3))-methyltransferase [Pigmentiphaga sp.]
MPLPRFHVDLPLSAGARVALPDSIAHHALRVLRLQAGAGLVVFDGRGGQYPAVLEIAGKQGYAVLGPHDPREAELPGRIVLAQAIPSGDKMDWVVEKAVEVGAAAVQPLAAARSVLRLSGERLEKRLQHWRRVAVAACEQCGRNRIPEVAAPLTLQQWLDRPAADGAVRLLCDPDAETRLTDWAAALPAAPAALELLVGPEGGWSDAEYALARRYGVRMVRFGDRILRTETAGTALISALSAKLGWV